MFTHPTLDKRQALRLAGMYHALVEQMQTPEIATLSFAERLGLLVDRESTERENRRLTSRRRQAKLRQTACIEDLDDRYPPGIGQSLDRPSRHVPVGAGASPRLDHRSDRHWENLARLCLRP